VLDREFRNSVAACTAAASASNLAIALSAKSRCSRIIDCRFAVSESKLAAALANPVSICLASVSVKVSSLPIVVRYPRAGAA
jgi:hypothetical protein